MELSDLAHRANDLLHTNVAELTHRAMSSAVQHPLVTAAVSIGASLVAILQSAQEVVGTLIALVSSIAGLVTAIVALRGAYKKSKEK